MIKDFQLKIKKVEAEYQLLTGMKNAGVKQKI